MRARVTVTLKSGVLDPQGQAITGSLKSLHEVIDQNWTVNEKPELFCFGLLKQFDIPQLRQLIGEARLP